MAEKKNRKQMKNFTDIFKRVGGLSKENEKILLSSIKKVSFGPKIILQKEGKVSDKIYVVETGIARAFYHKDGKDITYAIATQNDFIGSMSSFFMQTPSNKTVETIEACVLWEFEYNTLQTLFDMNTELGKAGRLFANYGVAEMERRFDNMMFYTARERYEILLNNRSEVIQKVPLGMIASYLGISQETLSRIRK